jgi:hypothetical protein
LRDAKRVLRVAIDACLEGRSLNSREVMQALRRHNPAVARAPQPPQQQPAVQRPEPAVQRPAVQRAVPEEEQS